MKKQLFTFAVAAALLSGCAGTDSGPTQAEAAKANWNSARAAVLASLAKDQFASGQTEKCRQTLDEALKLDPQSLALQVLSARVAIEQGRMEQARLALEMAAAIDSSAAEVDYLNGVVAQRLQQLDLALERYRSAAMKAANELAYTLAEAETLVALKRVPEAVAVLESRKGQFEAAAPLLQALGQLYVTQKNYPKAVENLKQASLLATDDVQIREHLALAYFYNGQHKQSLELLSRLIRDPGNAERFDLMLALGECQFALERYRDAKATFEQVTNINPALGSAWLSLAKASLELGDLKRAEMSVAKAISLHVPGGQAHLLRGYLRLKQKRVDDAIAEFRKAADRDSNDPVSLCMIGYALEQAGRKDLAVDYYGQALRLKPRDELATQLMASLRADE
jgi:tetratricopeptide (TPR) repeat protein